MPLVTIAELHRATGFDRNSIARRVNEWGLPNKFSPKRVLQLLPLDGDGATLETAKIESYQAKARRDQIEAQIREREHLPKREVEEAMGRIAEAINTGLSRPEIPPPVRVEVAEVIEQELRGLVG